MFNFISKTTRQLNLRDINLIYLLKDSQWKFGKKSQLKWFKKNIKSFDIHNLLSYLICNNNLVNFYKKYNWRKLNNSSFEVVDYPFNTNGMIFNYNNTMSKLKFYIN